MANAELGVSELRSEALMRLRERYGFGTVGVEREVGHKFGRWLDVVVMQMMVEGRGARISP